MILQFNFFLLINVDYILCIFIIIGIVVGLIFAFKKPDQPPQIEQMATHVCVSQLTDAISALPTTSHKDFCTALNKGLPSKCQIMDLKLVDENGDNMASFNYHNGAYYPQNMPFCSSKGKDILMFRAQELEPTSAKCSKQCVRCINNVCYQPISGPFTVSQVVIEN